MASLINMQGSKNRDKKLIRAVNSFLKQTHEDKELIIVSDGCDITNRIYDENWKTNPIIKLFPSPKQVMYSGGIRNIGCKMATGDIITYLDNDDVLGKNHLSEILNKFDTDKYGWVYYDDLMVLPETKFTKFQKRMVEPRFGSIGTSSISHVNFYTNPKYKGTVIPEWNNLNGYGHDFLYVLKLASFGGPFMKLKDMAEVNSAYIVCHYFNCDE